MVKQMLLNLLSNAIKFTGAGGHVVVSAQQADHGRFEFRVTDDGIGIASEDLPNVLTTFGQVQGAMTRDHEGTGLGLPLVASLAKLHGGGLELTSEIGVGTTATVWFPKERVAMTK
jgi:signal transduction histidine kinase